MANISVQVQLYATFRLIAGEGAFTLDLAAGADVQEALRLIVERFPQLERHWFGSAGELHAHVHVFLNESEVPALPQGWQTRLAEGDTLTVFPPVAGG